MTGRILSVAALAALASVAGSNSAESSAATPAAPRPRARTATTLPTPAAVALARAIHLDTAPPRKTVGLEVLRNGWVYNCMECHTLFAAKWHHDYPLNEHRDINLEHGKNRFCLNCHHPSNRNAFVDYDGTEIAPEDSVQLCAKCHGTIFRDWQAGVHGRQNGRWNAPAAAKAKLRCIQCHDPHQPRFADLKPLAPLRYPPRAANSRGTQDAVFAQTNAHEP